MSKSSYLKIHTNHLPGLPGTGGKRLDRDPGAGQERPGQDSCCGGEHRCRQNLATGRLQEPVLDKAHTAFRHLWQWDGNKTEIVRRAVDETGYTQPAMSQLVAARGADMGAII